MNRRPTPTEIRRPTLLRLALWLAPEAQRMWLEDMADEHAFVPATERPGWIWGALALALRWRVVSWQAVPRAQLAVTVMALALLAASPWLLREYALNTLAPVSETEVVGNRDRLEADQTPSEEAASGLTQQAPAPVTSPDPQGAIGNAEDRDALVPAVPDQAARAVNTPEPLDDELQDQAEAEGLGVDIVGDPLLLEPDVAAEPLPSEPTEGAGERLREDSQRETNLDEAAQSLFDRQVVVVEETSFVLTLLRPTRLTLITGTDEAAEPYLDRRVETGERILVLPPLVVVADDGGAVDIGESGLLGEDGRPATRVFTTEAVP